MISIRLKLCSLLLVLVFALISCQRAEPSPEVIPTETTSPSSPTQETREESTATPPPESTTSAEEESYPAPQAESTSVSEGESYPAPQPDTSTTGYPSPGNGSPTVELLMVPNPYPGPDETTPTPKSLTLLSPEKFSLAPLQAGDTEIQGRGPAGLPIRLVDVTLGGDLLATGQIQDDGSFTIQLDKPLVSNQRVGLKVDSLQGTPFADQEEVVMQDAVLLMGENAFDIPSVGLVLTSQRVP